MKKKQKRQRQLLEQQISQLRELELHQTEDVSPHNCITSVVIDWFVAWNDHVKQCTVIVCLYLSDMHKNALKEWFLFVLFTFRQILVISYYLLASHCNAPICPISCSS